MTQRRKKRKGKAPARRVISNKMEKALSETFQTFNLEQSRSHSKAYQELGYQGIKNSREVLQKSQKLLKTDTISFIEEGRRKAGGRDRKGPPLTVSWGFLKD